jgi:hypothetical protein
MDKYIKYLLLFLLTGLFLTGESQFKFIENKGQWDTNVLLKANVNGGYLYIGEDGITYDFYDTKTVEKYVEAHYHKESKQPFDVLKCHSYKVKFLKKLQFYEVTDEGRSDFYKNHELNLELKNFNKKSPTKEYYNYFIGNDKTKWGSKAYGYEDISYIGLYKGIDLHYYTNNDHLKYDFIVSPNANSNDIQLSYEGVSSIAIKNNRLVVKTSVNEVV